MDKSGSQVLLETPEGARLVLVAAGPVVRAVAWSIDVSIRGLMFLLVLFLVSGWYSTLVTHENLEKLGLLVGLLALLYFALSWLYTIFFEIWHGATPGKRMMGLQVVQGNGAPLSVSGAVVRNLLRVVDVLPLLNVTGLVTMTLDTRFRRLGDLAADTLVVYRQKRKFHSSGLQPDAGLKPLPPPASLSLVQQQAIVDFVERGQYVTKERQQELAAILKPLMHSDDNPVQTLQQWAAWLRFGAAS